MDPRTRYLSRYFHEDWMEQRALFVDSLGLAPTAALEAASRRTAELLGTVDSVGTVAPEMAAELVLPDADPLADIRNTRTIAGVARGGRIFDREVRDRLLVEVEERRTGG